MKLLIQLTFNNGLGNLYCGAVEILHFVQKYKEIGYNAELIFAINGSAGGNKFLDFCYFEDIFDVESFKIFDKISTIPNSIGVKEFEGYKYHSTQYGPDYPGAHWWDVFFDVEPEVIFPKNPYNMETLQSGQLIPTYIPKLNHRVYERANNFIEKNKNISKCIQVRYFDFCINPTEELILFADELYDAVSKNDNIFHLSSNNQFIIDKLSGLSNIRIYGYQDLDKLPNDHNYYFFFKNFDTNFLLDRLIDNLAEMVVLSNYDEIFYKTYFSWNSTFLYYSKSNNKEQKLTRITKEINFI